MAQIWPRPEMWLASLLSLVLVRSAELLPNTLPDPVAEPMADPVAGPLADPAADPAADPLPYAMRCGYHGYCYTEAKGFITKSSLRLPDIEVPPGAKEFKFIIPDKCSEWGRELAGCVVHACDTDAAPALRVGVAGVGRASISRQGTAQAPANIYMKQYCV